MLRSRSKFERLYVVTWNTPPEPAPGTEPPPGGGAGGGQKDDVAAMKAELESLRKEKADRAAQDLSLGDKIKLNQQDQDKKVAEQKSLESALTFNLTSLDFLKQNDSILPKGAADIFKAADKEKYDSPIQKANAIKAALIDLHFSQQSNVDFLTDDQKEALADYQKLTKNGKEEKSNELFKNVFKPALDTLKRVKKAEEVSKAKLGLGSETDSEKSYLDKLSKMAEKKFFKGKN